MFKFLFHEHTRVSACTYYRQEIPARMLEKLGFAITNVTTPTHLGFTPGDRLKKLLTYHALLYYALGSKDLMKLMKITRKLGTEKHSDGTITYPPIFIGDMDDHLHYVSPMNPRFGVLGTRDEEGKLFQKGEEIWIRNEQGERYCLWKDGEGDFDVKRNRGTITILNQSWKLMDGMTFSTQRMADYYVPELGLKRAYVYPNSVVFDDYPKIPIHRETGTIKVMWQGGDSHYADWYGIRDWLPWTCSQFPEVRWLIFGSKFPFIHNTIPADQFRYVNWVPYQAYRIRLATLDFDFTVIPLADNKFNRAKSCIKWYEASALPEPRPVLAARVPPYSDEIIDGETGLLYSNEEEFKVKFEALVRDAKLRQTLAENAKDWVATHRDAHKTAVPYMEWLVKTIDAIRLERWPLDAGLPK